MLPSVIGIKINPLAKLKVEIIDKKLKLNVSSLVNLESFIFLKDGYKISAVEITAIDGNVLCIAKTLLKI